MNDTIIIYREPAKRYDDGYKPEAWVTVVLHRQPFQPVHPNRSPDAGSDRTVHVGLADRAAAIAALEVAHA